MPKGSKRGPRPAPTPLKLLKGEQRPSRVNADPPEPPTGDDPPDPPEFVTEYARGVWMNLASQLWPVRLLTEWDLEMFAAYCVAADLAQDAARRMRADGIVVVRYDEDGHVNRQAKHSAFQVWRDATSTMRGIAQEFGLTPSARATIKLERPVEDEEARRLLS